MRHQGGLTERLRCACNKPVIVQDLENTVGAWDMYGQEDQKRYPDLQNEFFERAASSLASRGAMLRFLAVGVPPRTACLAIALPNSFIWV